ncbi:MAG: PAS domain S-box protein [Candidatus Bathyarchaeota archaeon]|nr:PAS domain S-box protein [Candidatus Bathyarchaeota archaeon]MDW8040713.1 PAS domain S-box protein [Nitrososphaerota archaeon]
MAEDNELIHVLEELHAFFDGLGDLVYVADPQTYEILFANDKFRELFGVEVVGKKCYEVIHDRKTPCPFCTNKHIFGENLGKIHVWEYHCKKKGRWYKCIDRAIRWPGNKYVRFEIAVDITGHKETERALTESERRYRNLVEAAPDVIYTVSSGGKIVSLNPAFERITGWKCEEWIGKPFTEIIHPDDVFKAVENFQKTLAGKAEPVELRVRSKSGDYLIGEFISVPLVENGEIVGELGIARDVTSRRKHEDELQKISTTLHTLIQAIPDIVYFKDAERRNLIVNSAFERFVNLKREEIVGKKDEEILPRDLAEQCRKSDEMVLRDGVAVRVEEYTVNEKGKKRFFDTIKVPVFDRNGKVAGLIGVSRDITERKLIEEKLREREELFRSVVENSHDGIAIVDENLRIIYANDVLAEMLGYSRDEMAGQDFRIFLAEESKALFATDELREKTEQPRGQVFSSAYELKIKRKNGEEGVVEVKATTLWDAHGRMRTVAQILDVTTRKKLEEERKLFEKRLSELNKYAQRLNKAKGLKEIYRLTLDAMEKTLGFEYASILMVKENVLCLVAHRGYSKVFSLKLSLNEDKGITVRAARLGRAVYVPDVRRDSAYVKGGEGICSELAVPMKVGKKVLGVLNVESQRINAFNEDDRKLLEALASHAAVAINNLKRQEKLAALNAYGRDLGKAKSIEEICKRTLNAMQKILGFKYMDFFMVAGKKLRLMGSLGLQRPLKLVLPLEGEKGVTVRAAKTGKAVYVPDVRKDPAYVDAGVKGLQSELAVPIKLGERVLGVLNVECERLDAFDEEDKRLLEILASHVAIALTNIERTQHLAAMTKKLENLLKGSAKTMTLKDTRKRLKEIAKTIQKFGWQRVVIGRVDENLNRKELITVGLTKEEVKLLRERRAPGQVWRERFGPTFDKFKIGEFYYIPWTDPWAREHVFGVPPDMPTEEALKHTRAVPSRLSEENMIDWHPQDMLYAPLRTPEGKIVGILSMDDPVDGKKPTKESLMPLAVFLHLAAVIIENAELMESLEKARKELEVYANQLEEKVEERTRELREMHERLLKAQRMAVIGELAGMVGHDLRNPLTSIAGAAYYLKRRLNQLGDEKVMEMLELIEKNIAYSNKIINDLLDYSREVRLDITETTPESIINEALATVEVPNNIKVVKLVDKKPKMKADFEKLKRVFVNLIRNAVEAMPKGGTLTIKSMKKGGNVVFTVSDTGVGISEEVMKRMWTPLFTTKAKGMGFGLPICKRFVEAHGGTITVESAPGKGATFTVTLPLEPKTEEGGEKVWLKTLEFSLSTTTKT